MLVFLQRRAAAGGVGDDGVEIAGGEGEEIFAREVAGGVANSGVSGERAAARLIFGHDDFAAVGGEDADGRVVETREGDLRDAAGEECDASAALADCGKCAAEFLEEKWSFDFGEKLLAVGEAEKFEHAGEARDALQAGALVEPEEARERGDAIGVGKKFAEGDVAQDAREERALVVALDERAGVFDELAVFDDGGAGGFAGAAVEAFVDVIDEGFGDRGAGAGAVFGLRKRGRRGRGIHRRGRRVHRGGGGGRDGLGRGLWMVGADVG